MSIPSTKPYLIRAIYQWCGDHGFTPYLAVQVDGSTQVPMEHVRDGQIVLNVGASATPNLMIGVDLVEFTARFNGVSQQVRVPMGAVVGVYSRENGEGLFFAAENLPSETVDDEKSGNADDPKTPPRGKPKLTVIK